MLYYEYVKFINIYNFDYRKCQKINVNAEIK